MKKGKKPKTIEKQENGEWDGLNVVNIASRIAKNKYVDKILSLTDTIFSSQVFKTLLDALIPNQMIETVDFSNSKINEKEMSLMFQELKKNNSITKLILKGIPITQKNLQEILELFSSNIRLEEIEMEIDEESWKKIKKSKEDNPRLIFQSCLRSNKNIQKLIQHQLDNETTSSRNSYPPNIDDKENNIIKSQSAKIFNLSCESFYNEKYKNLPTFVNLSNRNMPAVPLVIFNFINISELNLSLNNLDQIPDQISHLRNLKKLNLDNNRLKVIPDSIALLEELNYLFLANNLLECVPLFLRALGNLKEINLENNKIKQIPYFLASIEELESLQLQGNIAYKNLPKKVTEGNEELLGYLKANFVSDKKIYEGILMILGSPNVGKSKLIESLFNKKLKKNGLSYFHKFKNNEKQKIKGRNKSKSLNNLYQIQNSPKSSSISFENLQKKDVFEKIIQGSENAEKEEVTFDNNEDGENYGDKYADGVNSTKFEISVTSDRNSYNSQFSGDCGLEFSSPHFARNDILQHIYKIYMSSRSIYLICFNLLEPQEPNSKLEYWLQLIKKDASSAPVIYLFI